MKPIVPTVAALLVAATAVVWACKPAEGAAAPGAVPTNLVLRTYEVAGENAAEVRGVLKTVLFWGSDGKDSQKFIGRADVTSDGRLVVLASEDVQSGVKTLVDSVSKHPPKSATSVELTYWLVQAAPAGKDAPRAAGLQEIAPALAEIEKADGPQQFTLAEKLAVTSLSGDEAFVQGRDANARQVTVVAPNGINAVLTIQRFGNRLETRVKLTPGQIVVLGSAGMKDKDESAGSLYFLIRAATHDGQGR